MVDPVNLDFLGQLSERLGIALLPDEPGSLLEGRRHAQRRSDTEAEAWLCTQLGDYAFGAEGLDAAAHWYAQGRLAAPQAREPWVGLAQVALASRSEPRWQEAMAALATGCTDMADPDDVTRAQGLLATHDVRLGQPPATITWGGAVDLLLEEGRAWSAWHVQVAGAVALNVAGASHEAEHAYAEALDIAQSHRLERAIVWTSLSLSWHVQAGERPAEAEEHLATGLAAAEALGDPSLVGAALALGCDIAAELGQSALLVERLRRRADLAANEGSPVQRLDYLYQAFVAAFRARQYDSGTLGEEFVEAFVASDGAWGVGVDMSTLLHSLISVDAHDHAIQFALRLSQHAFQRAQRTQAATWLAEAARLSCKSNNAAQGVAMLDEAIQISKVYDLGIHSPWEEERVVWGDSEL
jgi:hypothetical protein